jgi:uncharacterized protein YndB with AHSA1/START domain
MTDAPRKDFAARVIEAPPDVVYRAFIDPASLIAWLPPKGMTGQILHFDARPGGAFRMVLTLDQPGASTGKTTDDSDIVEVRFVDLVVNERIVQLVDFESKQPEFAGTMRMTWTLRAVPQGTEVSILCEDVPSGISKEDHDAGLQSSLENLAAFAERQAG